MPCLDSSDGEWFVVLKWAIYLVPQYSQFNRDEERVRGTWIDLFHVPSSNAVYLFGMLGTVCGT